MLHRFRTFIILILTVGALTLTACSNLSSQSSYNKASFTAGENNFSNEHYSTAFVELLPYAVRGYRDAEYAVGYMYYYGKGVGENEEIGSSWLCRAKKHNQLEAIALLQTLPVIDCSNPLVIEKKGVHKKAKPHR